MDLTQKMGPLPMWGWGAGLLGGALVYSFVSRARQQSAANAAATTAAGTVAGDAVPSDQVPDYINNVNVSYAPPTVNVPVTVGSTPPVAPPPRTFPTPHPIPAPKPPGRTSGSHSIAYTVRHGDTLSSIAQHYGTSWQKLWQYNTSPGVRPASTIATLKQRGPNLLYSGETIYIPTT